MYAASNPSLISPENLPLFVYRLVFVFLSEFEAKNTVFFRDWRLTASNAAAEAKPIKHTFNHILAKLAFKEAYRELYKTHTSVLFTRYHELN